MNSGSVRNATGAQGVTHCVKRYVEQGEVVPTLDRSRSLNRQ